MLGAYLSARGSMKVLLPAQQVRTLITQDYLHAYERATSSSCPSPVRLQFGDLRPDADVRSDMFTISNNIAGTAGSPYPWGLVRLRLPVSAQLQGPAFKDRTLLRLPVPSSGASPLVVSSRPISPGRG